MFTSECVSFHRIASVQRGCNVVVMLACITQDARNEVRTLYGEWHVC